MWNNFIRWPFLCCNIGWKRGSCQCWIIGKSRFKLTCSSRRKQIKRWLHCECTGKVYYFDFFNDMAFQTTSQHRIPLFGQHIVYFFSPFFFWSHATGFNTSHLVGTVFEKIQNYWCNNSEWDHFPCSIGLVVNLSF